MNSRRKKIFVIGTGRSGTCWVGDILGRHLEIRSFVEVQPVFGWVTNAAINPDEEDVLLPKIFSEYARLFDQAAPSHFADKSHPCIWIAEKLATQFPNSYFLGVTRAVEPTVASMLKHAGVRRWCEQWQQYNTPNRFLGITEDNLEWYRQAGLVERSVARWHAHQLELSRLQNVMARQFFLIKYESLIENTCATLKNVRNFLSLDADFPPVEPIANSLTKWKEQLTPGEVERIQSALTTLCCNSNETR